MAADAQATVPPYIAAEAQAVGLTAAQLAQQVVDTAAVWNEQVGPAIEAARMGGKAAVTAAADAAAVDQARDAAIAALAEI